VEQYLLHRLLFQIEAMKFSIHLLILASLAYCQAFSPSYVTNTPVRNALPLSLCSPVPTTLRTALSMSPYDDGESSARGMPIEQPRAISAKQAVSYTVGAFIALSVMFSPELSMPAEAASSTATPTASVTRPMSVEQRNLDAAQSILDAADAKLKVTQKSVATAKAADDKQLAILKKAEDKANKAKDDLVSATTKLTTMRGDVKVSDKAVEKQKEKIVAFKQAQTESLVGLDKARVARKETALKLTTAQQGTKSYEKTKQTAQKSYDVANQKFKLYESQQAEKQKKIDATKKVATEKLKAKQAADAKVAKKNAERKAKEEAKIRKTNLDALKKQISKQDEKVKKAQTNLKALEKELKSLNSRKTIEKQEVKIAQAKTKLEAEKSILKELKAKKV
jgi:chromosome segregation ATPase